MKRSIAITIGIIAILVSVQTYLAIQDHIAKQKAAEEMAKNTPHEIECLFSESDWTHKFRYSYSFLSNNGKGQFNISDSGVFDFDMSNGAEVPTIKGNLKADDQVLLFIWNDSKKGTVKGEVFEDGNSLTKVEGPGFPNPVTIPATIK